MTGTLVAAGMVALAASPASAAGLTVRRVDAPSVVNSQANHTATATCPAGEEVIGVGYELHGPVGMISVEKIIPSPTSVLVGAGEVPGGTTENWSLTATAMCVPLSTGVQIVTGTPTPVVAAPDQEALTGCPAGLVPVGVGFSIDGAFRNVALADLSTRFDGGVRKAQVIGVVGTNGFNGRWSITSYAICVSASLPGLEYPPSLFGALDSTSPKTTTAACPQGKALLGSGVGHIQTGPVLADLLVTRMQWTPPNPTLSGPTVTMTERAGGTSINWGVVNRLFCADGTNV